MREIKFRAWDNTNKKFIIDIMLDLDGKTYVNDRINIYSQYREVVNVELMQYTGLKDKNGEEIYEFMELDNKWEVDWLNGKYILRDISNNNIIDLNYENKYEITKEYTKV